MTTAVRMGERLGLRGLARFGCAAAALVLAGCQDGTGDTLPPTEGERHSGYTYIPLDPLPVLQVRTHPSCVSDDRGQNAFRSVLGSLPDNAVRMAVQQLDAKGSATLGPATTGAKGSQYKVILDYINADAVNIRVLVTREPPAADGKPGRILKIRRLLQDYSGGEVQPPDPAEPGQKVVLEEVVIPVYVGVGMRLTAFVNVVEGNVKLGSLGALAAEADLKRVQGSLVVQTLGITGKQVIGSLPLPSDLNPTSIQNAIVAFGAVKAVVPDEANTILSPRVTGIYNPLDRSDERTVNLIVSELAREPLPWPRPCVEPAPARR